MVAASSSTRATGSWRSFRARSKRFELLCSSRPASELTIGELEDRRIAFRVGVNIGDVIVEPHDIFGDGVNIAARLESIAEPGGICISSSAYDNVRGKVGVEFADLGEQNLKNIALPVRAYVVVRDGRSSATHVDRARLSPA